MISEKTIEEVKLRVNLVELISESVALKRQGSGFMGLCPFHSERSPSFSVRADGGFYHCFGCGASGNVITFFMASRGLSFVEAIEELAQRVGITVERTGATVKRDTTNESKPLLYEINRHAYRYFRESLKQAVDGVDAPVRRYLEQRGIGKQAITEFGIGYAPQVKQGLLTVLRKHGIADDDAIRSGAVRRTQSGELIDSFRGRLVFPVFLDRRRIAGFGGRMIPLLFDGQDTSRIPKYLNSPETPIYQKSKLLYGLPQALNEIRERKHVFMVEGYLDVIGLNQAGISRVLATCGTAITPQHVQRLQNLVRRLTVLFDGDSAGMNAAGKAFELFLNSGIDADALFLPDELDPDSFAKANADATAAKLDALPRLSLFDCFLQKLIREEGAELGSAAKGRLAEKVCVLLAKVQNSVERHQYIQQAALRLMVPADQLAKLVAGGTGAASADPFTGGTEAAAKREEFVAVPELPTVDQQLLLAVMAERESLIDEALHDPELCNSEALHPTTMAFLQGLHELQRSIADVSRLKDSIKDLLAEFGPTWKQHWRAAHEMKADSSVNLKRTFMDCQTRIRKQGIEREIAKLKLQLASAVSAEEKQEVATKLQQLERSKRLPNFGVKVVEGESAG